MGKTLRELGVVASMGARGCAYDNAACESAIGTIKLELVEQHVFATRDVARLRVFDYIEAFYNPLRMHTTLGDLSGLARKFAHVSGGEGRGLGGVGLG